MFLSISKSKVLNTLLPTNIEISTAYEQVGDLVYDTNALDEAKYM